MLILATLRKPLAASPEDPQVRERIAPEITSSLFANYRSSADAVLELIDNAIDSRLPKASLTVGITVHPVLGI